MAYIEAVADAEAILAAEWENNEIALRRIYDSQGELGSDRFPYDVHNYVDGQIMRICDRPLIAVNQIHSRWKYVCDEVSTALLSSMGKFDPKEESLIPNTPESKTIYRPNKNDLFVSILLKVIDGKRELRMFASDDVYRLAISCIDYDYSVLLEKMNPDDPSDALESLVIDVMKDPSGFIETAVLFYPQKIDPNTSLATPVGINEVLSNFFPACEF